MEEEAMVLTMPAEPTKAKPWVSEESLKSEEKVEEAVEKRPEKPMTVEVEL